MPELTLRGESITLAQAVKAAGLADSGGQAKHLVRGGTVTVNGAVETRPGRQLAAGGGVAPALAAEASWEAGRQDGARHAAYQSAQTTANYLAWFINSYTVLVSVGSTALVARFVGAGDRAAAIRVTNQSILLAVAL